jgi:hypothetical protein
LLKNLGLCEICAQSNAQTRKKVFVIAAIVIPAILLAWAVGIAVAVIGLLGGVLAVVLLAFAVVAVISAKIDRLGGSGIE